MASENLFADFYSLFMQSFENIRKNKEKAKSTSESNDENVLTPLVFEISSNASKFAAFAAIRSLVHEHETKYKTLHKLDSKLKSIEFKNNDENCESRNIDNSQFLANKFLIPHIVSAGIQTLFEIISETKHQHPAICTKALLSLFDIFQGHEPESLKSEPDVLFHSLYDLLLELATWPGTGSGSQKSSSKECNDERRNWSAISCSVLLSLCIARGDTGKMIKAITSILMSSNSLLLQSIKLPDILIKLQKSVECAALGKLEKPRFYEYGVPKDSLIDEFPVKNLTTEIGFPSLSIASDGKYLFILHGKSLYKIGSGYSGTTKGLIYKMNLDFTKDKRGWIGFCQNKLYYKKLSKRSIEHFIIVDRETLTLQNPLTSSVPPMKRDANNFTLYSDGDSINAISAIKDSFVIREIIPPTSEFPFDITLNLSRRSFKTFGYTPFEEEILNNSQLQKIQSSFNCFVPVLPDEAEVCGIVAGKEFGLVMTSSSKVFYYGKGASLGIKSLIKSPSLKLSELTISKVSKITQISLFHDGLHALLMSNDGSVFFAGTARRGEDGEISKRRLLKPIKPKRISRLDNHFIVHVSSNNGTSAFVTKTGKLIMYGKDTSFCDSHGIVSQLHDQHIVKIVLGKAHTVALNSKGEIFSFGVNNKGQCGRTFSQVKDKMSSQPSASNSDYSGKSSMMEKPALKRHVYVCEVDDHEVVEDHCKICKICFECTGYNKMCSAASKITIQNRIGGSKCFCGHGNSGCVKCGTCSTCITKQESDLDNHIVIVGSPPLHSDKQRLVVVKKEVKIDVGEEVNVSNESERVAPMPPGKVVIPSSSPVVQISCGLHHTVVLTAAGEVFTFGSNQYGQLGTGNLETTTTPVLVKIPAGMASQVGAGSNHTVVLSSNGVVYTFGNNQKGQLGRQPSEVPSSSQTPPQGSKSIINHPFSYNEFQFLESGDVLTQRQRLNCIPTAISGIGPNFRKKACWISASGDQTFVKIDESLINASYLNRISIAANKNTIVFISNNEGIPGCITINKHDGKCITHNENQFPFFDIAPIPPFISDHENTVESTNPFLNPLLTNKDSGEHSSSSSSPSSSSITSVNNTVFTFDPLYDVLWGFDVSRKTVMCFNILASKVLSKKSSAIFKADITLPKKNSVDVTRVQSCLNILACLDTLAFDSSILDTCYEPDSTKSKQPKSIETLDPLKESKETKKICRFDAFGGGWGYFGHSVEAVRFMCDTDIVMDGIGMYGGRGEYTCKVKLFDLDFDGGTVEKEGNLVLEIEDVPYFCPARTIHNIMFQKAVSIVAGKWYLLWVKVSGPSSDCGSSGQNIVVGDDQVVFTFKSSKKSNNGTDINSGQIPSILYRVVTHDRKMSTEIHRNEEICKISKQFINKISPESFENLVKLLNWSWSQFKHKVNEVEVEKISSNDELLINRYVYICQVCLRLLKKYINEIYPSDSFRGLNGENDISIVNKSFHSNVESSSKNNQLPTSSLSVLSEAGVSNLSASRKTNVENIQLAENIVNVRALLITILCDDLTNTCRGKKSNLIFEIMDECNNTFVSCFNAFYPTSFLKWDCLCDLLSQLDKGILYSRLLSSVLAGLAYDPTVNLKATFSIMSSHAAEQKAITSPSENSGQPMLQNAENYPYPVLVEQMMYNTQKEKSNPIYSSWNFKEILTRLLDIISRPIKLKIESVYSNSKMDLVSSEYLRKTNDFNLISNCCFLLSKTLAEIVYQSSTNDTDPTVVSPYVLQSTNVRFKKSDYSKTWNTGNFASDAICFTVDRPGIVLAGCCVYYGSGSYEYQLELFHDTLDSKSLMQHKWEVIESTYGKYDQENVHRNMVQLKFERPVPIRENTCYAVRFCAQGARTCSGDSGYQFIRSQCGTVFRFYPCDLSFNGTSPHRGQLPSLLYYSVPMSHQGSKLKNNKEILARDIALEFASDVIQRSCDLLTLARSAFLYALSSSSERSSSNSSNTTQTFDSEHNITPIEEHFDVSWLTNPSSAVASTPMIKQASFPYYSSTSQSPVHKDASNINFKEVSKKIETFSRGIMETLKLDKKFDRNSDCVEIKIDNASEVNPNDFLEEERSKKRASEDAIDSTINGNTTNKKPTCSNQLEKSESCESFGGEREKLNEMFTIEESSLFHTLLPLTVAHLSRLICSDPKISVEILNLVKMILPQISMWNQISNKNAKVIHKTDESFADTICRLGTTSNHYAVIESDHPYKWTSIYSYKVEFPPSVKWISLEFDPQCGTAQPEDCLKIYIPSKQQNYKSALVNASVNDRSKVKIQKNLFANDNCRHQILAHNEQQQILIKKFNTENSWPTSLIIVPGNELSISLETASNYLTDHKLNRYGFKCILIGYENIDMSKSFNNSLVNLESEFAYLGGMCSANLMRKDLIFSDEKTDDFWATENVLKKHSVLLSKGLSIRDGSLTMNNILEYDIIDTEQSHEKQFLKDFVFVTPDTAGGRLAAWIQPESRLDPNRCELKLFQDPIQCGWPSKLVIETRDQYGDIVYVPNMKIQLKITQSSSSYSNEKRFSKMFKDQPAFSPLPKVNYEPVVKEKERIRIKSITAMKAYSQYSFEELRMFTPVQQKTSTDLITAKDSDLCYSVTWTPECAGNFVINIIIDSVQVNENYTISVINANIPPPVKEHAMKKIQPQYKYRKFYAEYTAGLRVRLHPTLQADQIGIIKINDVISYIDEVENSDGIWVKLSTDSIRKFCSTSWCSSEAWCLAYNKHFNKRLLYSLIEPNKEKSTPNPKDDMNNVKSFEEENGSVVENEQEDALSTKKITVDDATSSNSDEREEDDKPPMFDDLTDESGDRTSQSNITAAIAGVVEGSANKLQAFQKWLRRDSISENQTVQRRNGSIPEVYNNNTLDLKKTNIDNLADKLSNDIITSPLVERIIPTSRVNRNFDRDNQTSKTSLNQQSNSEAKSRRQLDYDENTPKQALSPSVAETIRAIFAAFLWHEGLVHDAIACASFLKFHPSIPKNNVFEMDQTIVEQRCEALSKEDKIQQRHSVEIINTTNYLNARPSTLEALTKSGYCCVHYRRQRGKAKEQQYHRSSENIENHGCPPALKCLVFVWDELNKDFQAFINKFMFDRENKDRRIFSRINSDSKFPTKSSIDEGAVGGPSNTVWCDLCNSDINMQNDSIAFTNHLKKSHPGCGESAKGKGYNSNGVYCEGWAGQCGEEGVGATSWYLLCEQCRDRHMMPVKKANKLYVNNSLSTKTIQESQEAAASQTNASNSMAFSKKSVKSFSNYSFEIFGTMRDNALFLLDLNSHNGNLLAKAAPGNDLIALKPKTCVRQNSLGEHRSQNVSPSHRFSSTFVEEKLRKATLQKQIHNSPCYSNNAPENTTKTDFLWSPPETITCLEILNTRFGESESCNNFSTDNGRNFSMIGQNSVRPTNLMNENKFHRSFSMVQGWDFYSTPNDNPEGESGSSQWMEMNNQQPQNRDGQVVMRRKKKCLCDSMTDASLLNYPSKNLKRLVPEYIFNPTLSGFSEVSSSHDIKNDSQLDSSIEVKRLSQKSLQVAFAPSQTDEASPQFSLLNRPTISFIFEKHDLDKLRYLLRKNLRKALCSVYGLQALNWLLRSVTQLMCVHDIMWWFISSLVQTKNENDGALKLEDFDVCYEHPVAISNVDDRIQILLSQNLHMLLQSISDVTLSLPSGSAIQRLAIQCFCIKFRPSDHQFLHNSHVFGNISKILSKSEEFNDENVLFSMDGLFESLPLHGSSKLAKDRVQVYNYIDITDSFEFTISSRQAMVSALTDNSTETFWESDDEDRNKPKIIEISMIKPHFVCKSINIHIDNCRDLAYKVTNFTVYSGLSLGELNFLETIETESNIGSWYQVLVKDESNTHFRVEMRGVENNIRVRQIKVLGYSNEIIKKNQENPSCVKKLVNPHHIQQKYCEQETLRVFRVLTNQVFGKLIINQEHPMNNASSSVVESNINSPGCDSLDLREHMVGILFSRSKLTHLQKQIIVHIVHSIQKEAQKSHDEWEAHVKTICSTSIVKSTSSEIGYSKFSDVYCFEMLSMVLALSGSSVGRSYLSHQNDLIKDLLSLLHTASERVQRQVILLLRRILPEISPETLSKILDISYQPHKDVNYLLQNPKQIRPQNLGLLDHLLAIIAKSLQIQVKLKNTSGLIQTKNPNVKLSDHIVPIIRAPDQAVTYQHQCSSGTEGGESMASYSSQSRDCENASASSMREASSHQPPPRWFLYGSASTKLAENIICLIKDMMGGKLTDKWSNVTKTAVAECIINLSHMNEDNRQPENCLKTHTLWLALSALCVLSEDHVAKLSSSQWSKSSGGGDKRPLCMNHDDSITNAVIECTECGTLCCDCDRFLHLNRKTWTHHRTVCKEEEEAIKVELHETCGRIKLFWLLALADRKTLKGIVEFRDGHNIVICDPSNAVGRCRFCGTYGNTGLLAVGNVCVEPQCQEYSANACSKILPCGHFCGGINDETNCLPCLHQKCQSSLQFDPKRPKLTQDSDDMCMICFTEALSCAPSIQMSCGHVFHFHCSGLILKKRWNGARISFAFSQCPICKNDINHESLKDLLEPINALKEDVKRKALMRLKYEGIDKDLIDDHKNLAIHAMERYAYYVCCKCQKAYYGGEARCDVEMGENFNPDELVCGGCSDIAKAQMCPKHGSDFLEYKCRYCCSVAVFFCFGTTHFCDTCHDDFQRLTNIPKIKLPKCPAGPKASQLVGDECPLHIVHPPTGEEFALGCGICRNFHSF